MTDAERLGHIIFVLKTNKLTLAKKLGGQSDARLRRIINGGKITSKLALSLSQLIDGLDYGWILTGKGTPPTSLRFRDQPSPSPRPKIMSDTEPLSDMIPTGIRYDRANGVTYQDLEDGKILMTVPLVNQFAQAGYLSGYGDPQFLEELEKYTKIVDKHFRGVYRAFTARGDSMNNGKPDAIESGDELFCRRIEKDLWNSRFHLHDWEDFVIVHKDGVITKRIIKHDVENGIITIHSLNEDKKTYPDMDLYLDDIKEIYNIIEVKKKRGK